MLSSAYEELDKKFGKWSPLFYGGLPFVFAYVTGGCIIQYAWPFSFKCLHFFFLFFLIVIRMWLRPWRSKMPPLMHWHIRFYRIIPSGQCQTLTNHQFNVNNASSRLFIFRTVINIFRCLISLRPLIPPDQPLKLFLEYNRPNNTTITIEPSIVIKRIPLALHPELQELYTLIWVRKPDNIINLEKQPSYKRAMTILHLCPPGFHPRLRSTSDLKHAVWGVLKGLDWLHGFHYAHRDLQWDNVIQDMDGNIRLIDLEHSRKEGPVQDDEILQHWPAMEGGAYLKKMDMYCVVRMIDEYITLQNGEVVAFMDRLVQEMSAEDDLNDSWFSEDVD